MDSFLLWSYIYVFVTHWTGQQIACYLQESWNTPPSDPSLGVPRWSSMRQVYGRHSCLTHSEVPLSGLCGITMAATVTHGQPRKAGTWHSWTDSGMRREKKKTQPLQTVWGSFSICLFWKPVEVQLSTHPWILHPLGSMRCHTCVDCVTQSLALSDHRFWELGRGTTFQLNHTALQGIRRDGNWRCHLQQVGDALHHWLLSFPRYAFIYCLLSLPAVLRVAQEEGFISFEALCIIWGPGVKREAESLVQAWVRAFLSLENRGCQRTSQRAPRAHQYPSCLTISR